MAKRKRLSPMIATGAPPETAHRPPAPPIAGIAQDSAHAAALAEVTDALREAQTSGRMLLDLPLEAVDVEYLVRDRTHLDQSELDVLKASLRARGQQTPVEVTELGAGRYGLISGWRRLTALRQLRAEGADVETVRALLRQPSDASEAYLAMVEENEIRVGLSFYERARVVAKAVEQNAYDSDKAALNGLFGSVSRAKRSKVKSFLRLVRSLEGSLQFPEQIGERQGLALSKALEADPKLAGRIKAALRDPAKDASDEQARLQALLTPKAPPPPPSPQSADVTVTDQAGGGLLLSGTGLTPALKKELRAWLAARLGAPD